MYLEDGISGHSRGATVDLTVLRCDARDAGCEPLDMGTAFDFFGTRAHTDAPEVSAAQRAATSYGADAPRSSARTPSPAPRCP